MMEWWYYFQETAPLTTTVYEHILMKVLIENHQKSHKNANTFCSPTTTSADTKRQPSILTLSYELVFSLALATLLTPR